MMIRFIDAKKMFLSNKGWLKSRFHFSFAEYYNPENLRFGVLRVLNDDLVKANDGFDLHPHNDMEIVTYVVDGEITHRDSMGNAHTLKRGEVQYMSAGTGILHSEYNNAKEPLRFLQLWIVPDKKGHTPAYGDYRFPWVDRRNKWLHLVSSKEGDAPIKLNQDVNILAIDMEASTESTFIVHTGRQAYLVLIEGRADVNGVDLFAGDALEIVEENLDILAIQPSHFLIVEMKKAM